MSWQEIAKNFNLEISVIETSDLFGSLRIDPECYKQDFLTIDGFLEKKNLNILKDIARIADGDHSIFPENQKNEVRYLRAKDIKDFHLIDDDPVFVNKDYFDKQKRSHIKEENILLSIMGTVGGLTITPKGFLPCIANRAICILKEIKINPYYLFAYLISDIADKNIKRFKTGGVQERINLEIMETLKIPIANDLFQEKIEKIIIESQNLFKENAKKRFEAEQILLKELGLTDYKPNKNNISVRELMDCLRDNRFDAEYWQIKYDELLAKIIKYQTKRLGEIVTHKKGVEVGSEEYAEDGLPFIRIADFSIDGIDTVEKKISKELFDALKANYSPKKGEILFTKDGTIGISYALDEDLNAIVSGAFLRLKPRVKINNEYLALVLNSMICKMQIERMAGGAIIAHLKPDNALNLVIPILSDDKQALIEKKAKEAKKLKTQSKELLAKAKKAVEIFIEKDENAAIEYLNQ